MALRVDVTRRYGSVERFSDDIRRYLDDMPVSARRDSLAYRTQKFVKRNRLKLVFAGLLALSLAGGMIATVWKANEARHERALAEKRFESLRKLSDSFVTEIHGAIQNLPGSLPARQLLLRRATEQLDALAGESGDNRALQDELGLAYFNLASLPDMSLEEKESTNKKCVAIYEKLLLEEPNNIHYQEKLALAYMELADTEKVRGSVEKGFEYCKTAAAILDKLTGEAPKDIAHLKNLQNAVSDLASYYALKGDTSENLVASLRGQEIAEELRNLNLPIEETDQLANLSHLQIGSALTSLGNYKTAIIEIQTALDAFNNESAEKPSDTSINYCLWAASRRLAMAVELDGDAKKGLEHAQ